MNTPAFLLNPLGAALRARGAQRTLVHSIQRTLRKQLMDSYVDDPITKPYTSPRRPNIRVPTFHNQTARLMKLKIGASGRSHQNVYHLH